jgi:metal-dependent amidase/aminoacylase/carboxypeptidase family protein
MLPASAFAQTATLDAKVKDVTGKVVEWRRYFHEHPELSNREFNTAKKVWSI